MLRKNYFTFLTVAALFLMSSLAVFAQTAPSRGKVELKKADGTIVPAAEVVIDVYRTDAKGKLPSGKTDKKGNFAFAGLALGQVFMFAVSGPGVQAQIFPDIRAGQDNVTLTVYEGNGNKLTEEEARQLLATPKPTAGTGAAAVSPQDAAAAKKAEEEHQKQVAEINAKNEKAKNANQIINKALSEGNSAFEAKNYDVAIAKFTEGINADPEFAGTAPVLLNNRGISLRLRGFDAYTKSRTDSANKQSLMESAKKDFRDAASSFQKSLDILKNATTTDAKLQKDYDTNRKVALSGLIETYRLMIATRADTTQTEAAAAVAEQYAASETDEAQKAKTLLLLADALRSAGDAKNSLTIYRKLYETSPDNVDVLGGLGLSLVSFAAETDPPNKTTMQEALNLLDRFVAVAPDAHPLKSDVQQVVVYLKTDQKLTPQKTNKPAATKKKN